MMKQIKRYITLTIASLTLIAGFALPAVVHAAATPTPASQACNGINDAFGGSSCDATGGGKAQKQVGGIFATVINILSYIIGGVAVIMLVIGGLRYIISGGDSSGVAGAKNTIIYALVGLAVVIFAQVIVKFVIGKVGPAAGP